MKSLDGDAFKAYCRRLGFLYQDVEIKYGSGFIGLIPDYVNCGGTKLPLAVRNLIESVLNEYYDTTTRKHKWGAYGEYLLQSEELNLPTVSQTTFYYKSTLLEKGGIQWGEL